MTTPDADILRDPSELDGQDGEKAFFGLLHSKREALPVIEGAFRRASAPGHRARILEVARQLRWPEAMSLFSRLPGIPPAPSGRKR